MKENRDLSTNVLKAISYALFTKYEPRVFVNDSVTFVMFECFVDLGGEITIYGQHTLDGVEMLEKKYYRKQIRENGEAYIMFDDGTSISLTNDEIQLPQEQLKKILEYGDKDISHLISKLNSLKAHAHTWAWLNGLEDEDE